MVFHYFIFIFIVIIILCDILFVFFFLFVCLFVCFHFIFSIKQKEILSLIQFESSATAAGEIITVADYVKRMPASQKVCGPLFPFFAFFCYFDSIPEKLKLLSQYIYYLCAPNRKMAEQSPYIGMLKKKNIEVSSCPPFFFKKKIYPKLLYSQKQNRFVYDP